MKGFQKLQFIPCDILKMTTTECTHAESPEEMLSSRVSTETEDPSLCISSWMV